jgi:Na+-transporting NADH:ubiquinone oxidoreductase subunit NqrB
MLYGNLFLQFAIPWPRILLVIAVALLVQWLCARACGLPRFDGKSALISSLSLLLLLRADHWAWFVLAIAITIASKFLLRANDKHIFNPTNFGLVCMLLLTDHAWVSPGQWGTEGFGLFALACLGGLVAYRHARSDITWAFLFLYAGLLLGRAVWLGDPLAIPFHQLQNGAFLLFTFFMISDPKTSPDSRTGRIAYAGLVAVLAVWIQFAMFEPTALLWALVCCAPLVPVIDRLSTGRHYLWPEYQIRRKT